MIVGIAGFFGTVARYAVAGAVSRVDERLPWGTFVVNVTGSLALGFLVGAMSHRLVLHPDIRVALTVGFLGAYTTFSTFVSKPSTSFRRGTWPELQRTSLSLLAWGWSRSGPG